HGLRLPFRQGTSSIGDRLQRRPASRRRGTLRPAGIGSATVQFRRHRTGKAAAGKLVCPRASADLYGWRPGPARLERIDVRIPDAPAGDADLRKYPARPDLRGRGGATDRIWTATRRTVGNVGV